MPFVTDRVSRRDFLRASAGLTSLAFLAACAPAGAPSSGAAESGAAAPGTERVEITFAGWGATEEDEGVRAAIKQFESEQDKIKVTWLHTPNANTDYVAKLLTDIAAGTPPDTAFIGSDVYQEFIKENHLLDITDKLKADSLLGAPDYFIEPQEEQRCTNNGKWYGIGSCWVAPHMYYNADLFAEAGIEPPSNDPEQAWTWDHFLEVAQALTVDVNGKHPNEDGFDPENVERYGVDWPNSWWGVLHPAILANGGDWIDADTGLLVLDQPAATEALQRLADLVNVHYVMPATTAVQALGMNDTQMLDTGKLAMAVDGSWALSYIYKIKPKLGTAVLPGMTEKTATNMQAHFHSAFAATKHPEESWEWVRFLSTPFYQTQFCKIGLWLPSQSALMTDEGLQTWITPGIHPEGYADIPTKYLPKYGHIIHQPPGFNASLQIINPAIDSIMNGNATAEAAMAAAVPEANQILLEQQG